MSTHPEYEMSDFKTAKDWHIYHVYNDPEFIDDFNSIDAIMDDTSIIQDKYMINGYDIFYFNTRKTLSLNKNTERNGKLIYDIEARNYTLTFDMTITKAEFLEFWNQFSVLRDNLIGKPHKKRKPPENHVLVYAIFKARQNGLKFKEIYELSVDGKLPAYEGKIPSYMDSKKLEEFYNKYKPSKA